MRVSSSWTARAPAYGRSLDGVRRDLEAAGDHVGAGGLDGAQDDPDDDDPEHDPRRQPDRIAECDRDEGRDRALGSDDRGDDADLADRERRVGGVQATGVAEAGQQQPAG